MKNLSLLIFYKEVTIQATLRFPFLRLPSNGKKTGLKEKVDVFVFFHRYYYTESGFQKA